MRHLALLLVLLLALACQPEAPKAEPVAPVTVPGPEGETPLGTVTTPASALEEACAPCQKTCEPAVAQACMKLGDKLRVELDNAGAARAYEWACNNKHAWACSTLALHVQDGRGAPYDPEVALSLHEKACDMGAGIGCYNAANMVALGLGVDIQEDRSQKLLERAHTAYTRQCDAGELVWCMNLGLMYELGQGLDAPNRETAASLYRKACDGGILDACVNQSLLILEDPPNPRAATLALERLDKDCAAQNPLSCSTLGQLYIKEMHGIERDTERAIPLLEKACEGGISQGCAVLGGVFMLGEGVEKDAARALDFEKRACQLGDSTACFLAGTELLQADEPQKTEAISLLRQACRIGHAEACALLGLIYQDGKLVPTDEVRANAFYRSGCRMGYPGACVALLQRGEPLPLPPGQRDQILEQACKRGIREGCQLLGLPLPPPGPKPPPTLP